VDTKEFIERRAKFMCDCTFYRLLIKKEQKFSLRVLWVFLIGQ